MVGAAHELACDFQGTLNIDKKMARLPGLSSARWRGCGRVVKLLSGGRWWFGISPCGTGLGYGRQSHSL